jgi:sodium transport system permease protein
MNAFGIKTVFVKEVMDNLRDRRTLASALIFGPMFGPLIFGFMISIALDKKVKEAEEVLELPVIGAEYAPNFVSWLETQNVVMVEAPADPETAVRDGEAAVVLVIPESFAEDFRSGTPATLRLILDDASQNGAKDRRMIRSLIRGYSQQISALRLLARGIHPSASRPIALEETDLSTATARGVMILGMVPYFLIFSILMGAFNLAIDTTAGERERGSLEPLLTVPVSRAQLMLGKLAATSVFSIVAMILALLAFAVSISFVPLEKIGMAANFGPEVMLAAALVCLPFVGLGVALLTVVAAFTKTFKEAQTYLSFVLMVPLIPVIVSVVDPVRPTLVTMLVPSLSQHLLILEFMKGEPVALELILTSVVSTLILGALLTWVAARLYRRENLLNG